jgi:ADP-dependent phosphofructokinase/glucokinase
MLRVASSWQARNTSALMLRHCSKELRRSSPVHHQWWITILPYSVVTKPATMILLGDHL